MTHPPLPLVDGCLLIDNSSIEHITTCPTAAAYLLCHRRVATGSAVAPRYGTMIHHAMSYRYRNQDTWTEDEQIALMAREFAADPCETEGWRNLNSASLLIRSYNRAHPFERFKLAQLPNGELCVERSFAAYIGEVRGIKIVYTGRIDLAYHLDDGLFVHDWKTSSMYGSNFWLDYAMSEQQRGYAWALRECFGIEPTGFIVAALVTRESVAEAVWDDLLGKAVRPTKTGKESKAVPIEFGRQRFFTAEPPGQLDEWRDNLLQQLDNFLYQSEKGTYAKHHKHCVGKYGPCPYYHVDELPERSRMTALMSGAFTENKWSPLNQ